MSYTIAEVSEQLNISKVSVYKKIKQFNQELKPHLTVKKGIKYLDNKGIEIIKSSIGNLNQDYTQINNELKENPPNVISDEVLTELKELKTLKDELINQVKSENELLKKELEQKNALIERQTELIKNSQILLRESQNQVKLIEGKQSRKGFLSRIFKNYKGDYKATEVDLGDSQRKETL